MFLWFFFDSVVGILLWETGLLTGFEGTQLWLLTRNFPFRICPADVVRSCPSANCWGMNILPMMDPWPWVIDGKPLQFCLEICFTLHSGIKIDSINLFTLSQKFSLFDLWSRTGFVPLICMSCLEARISSASRPLGALFWHNFLGPQSRRTTPEAGQRGVLRPESSASGKRCWKGMKDFHSSSAVD